MTISLTYFGFRSLRVNLCASAFYNIEETLVAAGAAFSRRVWERSASGKVHG